MPFKSSKITYGLPQDPYDRETVASYLQDLTETLHLNYSPVGVRLLMDEGAYADSPCPEPQSGMAYCVMVKQAAKGKAMKSRLEHHKCDGGTTALGLEPSTHRIESGAEYFSYNLYETPAAARRHRAAIVSLHREEADTFGVETCPLGECTVTPDVVILMVNAWQAMRLVQGYEYATGIKPQIDMGAMQGMCSECTASPYLSGEMNVSVLCPSTRMLCKWEETDMAVGIPFHQFIQVCKGVVSTIPNY